MDPRVKPTGDDKPYTPNATYSFAQGGPLATCIVRASRSMSTAPTVIVRFSAGWCGSAWRQLASAHMKRFLVRIAAIVTRGETVFDQGDPAFVYAHFSAGDAGLGEAHEARLRVAPCA